MLSLCERLCDRESVDVRKLNIEQHDIRPQPPSLRDGLCTIRGLCDLEAGPLEHPPGETAESGMVVNDKDKRPAHVRILARQPIDFDQGRPDSPSG
jgi:hypothetical protein